VKLVMGVLMVPFGCHFYRALSIKFVWPLANFGALQTSHEFVRKLLSPCSTLAVHSIVLRDPKDPKMEDSCLIGDRRDEGLAHRKRRDRI
jgi:hypothetical protein